MYKDYLLATDMDGTLIGDDHKISDRNKQAIQTFTKQGGTFAIATGRSPLSAERYIRELPINAPCIFYNGGALYDWEKGAYMETEIMPKDGLIPYLEECIAKYKKMSIHIFTPEQMYIVTDEANNDDYIVREKQEYQSKTVREIADLAWMKILINDTHEILLECQQALCRQGLHNAIDNFFSSAVFLELVKRDVSKGNMLKKLAALPAYQEKIIVSAGDYQNDAEMLAVSHIGVAPQNAVEEAQAACDIYAPVSNNGDLLAYIIEEVIPMDYEKRRRK